MVPRFDDDELLQDGLTAEEVKKIRSSSRFRSGGSARNVIVVADIPGVGESHYTVQYLFDNAKLEPIADKGKKSGFSVAVALDGKIINLAFGISTHRATYPNVHTLWSQIIAKSQPNVRFLS